MASGAGRGGPDRAEQPVRKPDARGERRARDESARPTSERPRDKNWRPGGEHRDRGRSIATPRRQTESLQGDDPRASRAANHRERDGFRPAPQRGSPSSPEYSPPHGDPLRRRNRDERADREQLRFERPHDERRAKPTRLMAISSAGVRRKTIVALPNESPGVPNLGAVSHLPASRRRAAHATTSHEVAGPRIRERPFLPPRGQMAA